MYVPRLQVLLFVSVFKLNVCSSIQAEELVKQEMLTMLRNDLVKHPPPGGIISKAALSKAKMDLEAEPAEPFTEEEMKKVRF